MTTPKLTLRDAITEHLRDRGPAHPEEIHAALVASGITATKTASSVRTSLASSRLAFQLPDERWDLTTRALAGVVLTVRPRSRIRENVLWAHADLEPFDGLLTGDAIPLLSGGQAKVGGGRIRTFIGPDGWLPDIAPGELLALRWDGHALDVRAVDQPVPTDLTELRTTLRRHLEGLAKPYGQRPDLSTVLISALREVPDLFSTPQLPLSEVFPLSKGDVSDTSLWEEHQDGRALTLHLPHRVYEELCRCANAIGDRAPDHAAMLLGAAVDRVKTVTRNRYEYDPYDDPHSYPRNEGLRALRSVP